MTPCPPAQGGLSFQDGDHWPSRLLSQWPPSPSEGEPDTGEEPAGTGHGGASVWPSSACTAPGAAGARGRGKAAPPAPAFLSGIQPSEPEAPTAGRTVSLEPRELPHPSWQAALWLQNCPRPPRLLFGPRAGRQHPSGWNEPSGPRFSWTTISRLWVQEGVSTHSPI